MRSLIESACGGIGAINCDRIDPAPDPGVTRGNTYGSYKLGDVGKLAGLRKGGVVLSDDVAAVVLGDDVAAYDTPKGPGRQQLAAGHRRPRTSTVSVYLGFFAIPLGSPARPLASAAFNSAASSESSARLASRAASSTLPFFRNSSVALL